MLVQRPSNTSDITNKLDQYASCTECMGIYPKRQVSRHSCPKIAPSKIQSSDKKEFKTTMSKEMINFFKRLRNVDVSTVAKNDDVLLTFLKRELERKGMRKYRIISEKLRTLTTFLLVMRSGFENSTLSMKQLLVPTFTDEMLKAIYNMFHFNFSENKTKVFLSGWKNHHR